MSVSQAVNILIINKSTLKENQYSIKEIFVHNDLYHSCTLRSLLHAISIK